MSEQRSTSYLFKQILSGRAEFSHAILEVVGNQISEVQAKSSTSYVDLSDRIAIPSFVDVHAHGYDGEDSVNASVKNLGLWAQKIMSTGVSAFVPTIVSSPVDVIKHFIKTVSEYMKAHGFGTERADVIGCRLEGPFISKVKKGAHSERYLLEADRKHFSNIVAGVDEWTRIVRVVDIAPELRGARELISYLAGKGVKVSMGHSAASFEESESAVNAGATMCTHLFNGMRSIHHRDPGIAAEALLDHRVYAEMINDTNHLSSRIIDLAVRLKGKRKIVAITDSIPSTNLPDGRYKLGDLEIDVVLGKAVISGTNTLAGSTLTMDRAFKNFVSHGYSVGDAVRFCCTNPARALGLRHRGEILPGKLADITVLDSELKVKGVIRQGVLHEF